MFDTWENGRQRTAATGSDERAPRRRPAGLVPGWSFRRSAALRRLCQSAPRDRPAPAAHPRAEHLGWVIARAGEAGDGPPGPQVQAAALDMLDGTVADLGPAEDRQLALALAGAATAIAGHRAHLICMADQTATRLDAVVRRICAACGVRPALIPDDARIDDRAEGHRAQVVVASAARIGQDLLRDQAALGGRARGNRSRIGTLAAGNGQQRLVQGAPFAFVDDADLVMIETPRPVGFNADPDEDSDRIRAEEAFIVLRGLVSGVDYVTDLPTRRIRLGASGEAKLELAAALFEGPWLRRAWREETILAALTIRDFFRAGQDYTVQDGAVQLTRAPTVSEVEPGIEALIAAKENLAARPTISGLWTYRSFLSSYHHLGGTGFGLGGLSAEFSDTYGLEIRGGGTSLDPVACPRFVDARARAEACRAMPGGTVFWAPTAEDAKRSGTDPARTVVAEQVFALPERPVCLVQIATANARWENRLRTVFPGVPVHAFASGADGALEVLDDDDRALARFRAAPSPGSYRSVQEALARAASRQRAAHLRSDRYFERILAFTGDGP